MQALLSATEARRHTSVRILRKAIGLVALQEASVKATEASMKVRGSSARATATSDVAQSTDDASDVVGGGGVVPNLDS